MFLSAKSLNRVMKTKRLVKFCVMCYSIDIYKYFREIV